MDARRAGRHYAPMTLSRRALLASSAAIFVSAAGCATARVPTLHITPDGTGDGASWETPTNLEAIEDFSVEPGGEILIAADRGEYALTDAIEISQGGRNRKPIRIRGVNSATGEPMPAMIRGVRGEEETDVFRLLRGANHLTFSHFEFHAIGNGCFRVGAPISNITIEDCTADDIYRFLENTESGDETAASLSTFAVRRCSATRVQRGFARIRYGSRDGLFEDCRAVGVSNEGGDIPVGCALDDRAQNITYRRCIMENFQQLNAGDYWNGDGFSDEGDNRNIRYESCEARGSTDGGFDCKSNGVVLENCVAEDNKRNFRLWGDTATLTNCTSRTPNFRGAAVEIASPCHIWIGGDNAQIQLSDVTIEGDPETPILVVDSDGVRVQVSGAHPPEDANWDPGDDAEIVFAPQQ
ncbi:hypothetical protein [Terricaulis silvestris]|nr:hypothetical protein [Terricaulis silvestris]